MKSTLNHTTDDIFDVFHGSEEGSSFVSAASSEREVFGRLSDMGERLVMSNYCGCVVLNEVILLLSSSESESHIVDIANKGDVVEVGRASPSDPVFLYALRMPSGRLPSSLKFVKSKNCGQRMVYTRTVKQRADTPVTKKRGHKSKWILGCHRGSCS